MGGLAPSNFSEFLEYISPGLFPLELREMPPLLCESKADPLFTTL